MATARAYSFPKDWLYDGPTNMENVAQWQSTKPLATIHLSGRRLRVIDCESSGREFDPRRSPVGAVD